MPAARSLADDLRRRPEAELVQLVVRRPDLARPAPQDLTTLAARATTRASVQRALDGLDLAHLQALEALTVAGPAPLPVVAGLLGEPPRSPLVAALVDDLCALALCWRSPDGVRVARTVQEVVGDPAGLGPATDDAPTGDELTAELDSLDASERVVLDALTWGPPTGVLGVGEGDDRPVAEAGRRLVGRRLLRRLDEQHVLLPRQVALALRGGRLHRHTALRPPDVDAATVDPTVVDATCGGGAAELLDQVAEVLDAWSANPPRVLRAGGLSVRDLGRLATLLEVDPAQAAWLVEVMQSAELVAADDSGEPRWMPTGESDDWSRLAPHERWARLAGAWYAMPAAPSLVGESAGGTRVNALSGQSHWPAGRQRRHDTLVALAALPAGSCPSPEELARLLAWRHPIRTARSSPAGAVAALREAEWTAVTGRGGLGTAGRRLIGGDPAGAAEAIAGHIPPAVDHVLVQADLTAVAPGRLDGPARAVIRLLSEVESRGAATVHRFTEASVRRALDTGWSADRVLAEVAAISRTGVPQPLDYLVRDVARRHGVARVGAVAAYVRSDDIALLDRMLADRSLGLLQLRRLAPTVVVSAVPPGTVLDLLREHAYAPVAEGAGGDLTLGPTTTHRTTPRAAPAPQVSSVDAGLAARIVAAMRSGEAARSPDTGNGLPAPTEPVVTTALLREAAADRVPVWIGYADDAGGVQRYLLRPQAVEAGWVRGTVAEQDAPRTFMLHRISGVQPAE